MAPGLASRGPPPTMLVTVAEWCGSLSGGRVISWSERWNPSQGVQRRHLERVVQVQIGQHVLAKGRRRRTCAERVL
ncbi:MAG TPA: hypothetical protein VNT27_03795 [Propionibacteriaceae bacterium]|nr:hypothetical protein [Propionibacteriaceae bacterium]